MLDDKTFDDYLSPNSEDQRDSIAAVRQLIHERCPALVEAIDEGKWFGGLLTYHTEGGMFLYALGPRAGGFTTFHMMPFYGSAVLRERHEANLKKFLTGKSCIKFKRFSELPEASIRDILDSTPKFLEVAAEMMGERRKR